MKQRSSPKLDFFNHIDRSNPLTPERILFKKVKIVCTMGPSCQNERTLKQMIKNGMDVARLNFSHGTHEMHKDFIKKLRKVAKTEGKHLGILQDIQGPKIRIGKISGGKADIRKGDSLVVSTNNVLGTSKKISCSYKKLHEEIKVGHRILIDDGLIFLVVEKIRGVDIHTRVVFGGTLKDNKGVNLPDTMIGISRLTQKDILDIEFGIKQEVDFVALSFISGAEDVLKAKRRFKALKNPPPIISKIETRLAVHNIDEIIDVSDGIMVARGDLGVECPLEKLPGLQKKIIRAANQKGKFVITATQMLESMTKNPRPTRAEASDVANAVLDGSDAVMLSAETASGAFPVETVKTMSRIIIRTEEFVPKDPHSHRLEERSDDISQAVTAAAVQTTLSLHASGVVAFTHSGKTAAHISRLRPEPIIVALSPFESICRRLSILWGVIPAITKKMKHTDDMPMLSKQALQNFKLWKKGSKIVMLSGTPIAKPGSTNLLKVYEIK